MRDVINNKKFSIHILVFDTERCSLWHILLPRSVRVGIEIRLINQKIDREGQTRNFFTWLSIIHMPISIHSRNSGIPDSYLHTFIIQRSMRLHVTFWSIYDNILLIHTMCCFCCSIEAGWMYRTINACARSRKQFSHKQCTTLYIVQCAYYVDCRIFTIRKTARVSQV